ncbi:efflux RND transporter periplasmic adaptor subunit [Mucilaginibacter lappiensis]|uniref:Multidrug efflux pump subunit AcrA (Membrane-fusion protein) n=1 Tax=Mucilaginibacter lappiensis TaxID=354630 RepID=A0A841JDG1_9SPHI|nr:HlyD family efflux transporter periplasmic adaptor subunit [Mucilaginibacter lappiensis]MBB6128644.1 multidrug efflux pump subunit AcrA (membrane-fusion protein) [Mucilaginibacter lappiensis]
MKNLSSTYFKLLALSCACLVLTVSACNHDTAAADDAPVQSQTPVTVTSISNGTMADSISLNATSSFMQKSYVKANAIGYIQKVYIKPGQYVNAGQLLFTIKTKEAQSIGNTINVLDTTFKFSGVNRIKAASSGYITQLLHQVGDYVQDGEQLAAISDKESFAFVMQLPYELQSTLRNNQDIMLTLPGGRTLSGRVASVLPSVDTLSQTQGVVIKVNSADPIPENLIARAHIIKSAKSNVPSLPKSAVLTNETQTDFWVMKLISDTTAIKVPVQKGIETKSQVEILSPKFGPADRIVITGNYGLADTAKVKIVKP